MNAWRMRDGSGSAVASRARTGGGKREGGSMVFSVEDAHPSR